MPRTLFTISTSYGTPIMEHLGSAADAIAEAQELSAGRRATLFVISPDDGIIAGTCFMCDAIVSDEDLCADHWCEVCEDDGMP